MFGSGSVFSGAEMSGSSCMSNVLMQDNNAKLSSLVSSISSVNVLL